MKKILFLISAVIIFTACSKIDSPNLSVFVNETYDYKFSYPSSGTIHANDMFSSKDAMNSKNLSVIDDKEIFNITISQNDSENLKIYVEKIWTLNKEDKSENNQPLNKKISDMEKINFKNGEAYQFTLENSFANGDISGYMLDGENTYIFSVRNELIYEIHFPSKNNISRNILNAFEFIDEKTNKITNQQSNIDNCKNNYKKRQDQCLLAHAEKQTVDQIGVLDESTCKEITENSTEQSKCYWLFAMATKKNDSCALIPEIQNEKYFTKENCENELNYKNKQSEWQLFTGIPLFDKAEIIYFGEGSLIGWAETDDDGYSYFILTNDSRENLPPSMKKYDKFRIEYYADSIHYTKSLPEKIVKDLQLYNSEKPAKILTTQLSLKGNFAVPSLILKQIEDNQIDSD